MSAEERFEDCDRCDERYNGEEEISAYLRDVEVCGGVQRVCIGCLEAPRRGTFDSA